MADTKAPLKIGATPGKLAFVGVLAIVFVFVLWNEFFRDRSDVVGNNESSANGSINRPASGALTANQASKNPQSASDGIFSLEATSDVDLTRLGRHDPFRMPADWKEPKIEIKEVPIVKDQKQEAEEAKAKQASLESLKALKKRGADMIIISDSQRLAIIGNETLEIGDVYEGLRVVSIEAGGLTVERID